MNLRLDVACLAYLLLSSSIAKADGACGGISPQDSVAAIGADWSVASTSCITSGTYPSLALSVVNNRFLYQGHLYDPSTGTYSMRARQYRPEWGSFVSPDPLSSSAAPSLYAFAGSRPLTMRDPFGLQGEARGADEDPPEGVTGADGMGAAPVEAPKGLVDNVEKIELNAEDRARIEHYRCGLDLPSCNRGADGVVAPITAGPPSAAPPSIPGDRSGPVIAKDAGIAQRMLETLFDATVPMYAVTRSINQVGHFLGLSDQHMEAFFVGASMVDPALIVDYKASIALNEIFAEEVAGGIAVRGLRKAPFNPSGAGDNCVNCVVAFFDSVNEGRLVTASPYSAWNGGSIERANAQIVQRTGAVRLGNAQYRTLDTARPFQFYVVYPGSTRSRRSMCSSASTVKER
jgi:RHS repeat-associated protein